MEGSGSKTADYDTRSVLFTYRSFERQQNDDVLLDHHKNYIDKISEDDTSPNEETNLLVKPKKQPREATTGRKVFIMLACLFLHFTASGLISALGVIYVELIRYFEAPHSEAALVQSLFMGMTIGGGVIFSAAIQKYGTGILVMISASTACLAYVASSFAPNVPTLIALIGVIAGAAMSIPFLSAFITVGWSFKGNRKTVLAVLTLGSTAGQMSFPYIAQFLVDNFRWNGSLLLLSGIILNCVPCGLLLHMSRHVFDKGTSSSTKLLNTVTGCLKDCLFLLFLGTVFLFSGYAPIEMWFIVDLTVLKGLERSFGTSLLSLLGVFGFIGRIIGAVFLRSFKHVDAMVHFSYSLILWGVGHYLVGNLDTFWGLLLAVIVRGVFAGEAVAVMPGSMIEMRGIELYPQTVALCNLMGGTAQIIGGLLSGVTVDITGGYDFIFTVSAVLFLVCGVFILAIWFLKKRQRKNDSVDMTGNKTTKEEIQVEKEPLIAKYGHIKHG